MTELALLPLQWPLVGRHEELELFTATLTDARAHGFVIHGSAGVGKTRLADQCLALADRAGRKVARATPTEGSSSVPLGALSHLLPPSNESRDLVTVVSELRPVLRDLTTSGPLVMFVDDLHLLDATSATLLGQLVDADLIFLVATVRSDATIPLGLASLWQRARVRRIDLTDLPRAGVDTLLHLVLRGPVEATTVTRIWTASQGNVLFVRELVLGAMDRGRLVHRHGVWRLIGPLGTTSRLQELLAARLGALDPSTADALDVVAVCEPSGLVTMESLVGHQQLELLDRAGIIAVTSSGRRQQVVLAHPLYGEILRSRLAPLTRRRLLLEHAARIEAHRARRQTDVVVVATARLDASGSADPHLLIRAAQTARQAHDFNQVERLGRAAMIEAQSVEAGLLVGEALHQLGSFGEAEGVLAETDASTVEDGDIVHLAEIRSRNLLWGLMRHDDALAVNRAAARRLGDRPGRHELALNEAMLLTYAGRPLEALAAIEAIPPSDDPRQRAMHAQAELPALVAIGRCHTAAEQAGRAFEEQTNLVDQIAIPGPGIHAVTEIHALADCGRLSDATALAEMTYEATPETAPPDLLIWLSHQLGRCALLSGRADTARRWLGESLARCDAHNLTGASRLVLSALATAHAWMGDAAAAAAAVIEMEQLPLFPFVEPEQELGRAWSLVASGDLPGAREVLRVGADRAAARGYRSCEAWLLHDVARLGDPASVAARLDNLAGRCEGRLVAAYAIHARAAAAGHAGDLVSATDRFEAMGAFLLAAEAATEASQALQDGGERRASSALGQRATALAAMCEGARTLGVTAPVMVVPLTPRERDIATFAAQGRSSKEIADQLFLSIRTVNNHLQNVYSKLGVSGRRQLAAALAAAGS